jgi:acyl carrier protein
MNILEEVKKAICKVNPGIDGGEIIEGAKLKDDLDIDSLDLVEVALALEEALNLTLPEEDMDEVTTVGDIVTLVESKLKVRNA